MRPNAGNSGCLGESPGQSGSDSSMAMPASGCRFSLSPLPFVLVETKQNKMESVCLKVTQVQVEN